MLPYLVSQALHRLHRGNVWVDQDCLNSLFLQRLDGLGATVVKFACLANGEATRPKDDHLRQSEEGVGEGMRVIEPNEGRGVRIDRGLHRGGLKCAPC